MDTEHGENTPTSSQNPQEEKRVPANPRERNIFAALLSAFGALSIFGGTTTTVNVCSDACTKTANGGLITLGIALIVAAVVAKVSVGKDPSAISQGGGWAIAIFFAFAGVVFLGQSVNMWVWIIVFYGLVAASPLLLIVGIVIAVIVSVAKNKGKRENPEP